MQINNGHYRFDPTMKVFKFVSEAGDLVTINNTNHQVVYSFNDEACRKVYMHTLEDFRTLPKSLTLGVTFTSDRQVAEAIPEIEGRFTSLNAHLVPYDSFKKASEETQSAVKAFFKQIECFANITFSENDKAVLAFKDHHDSYRLAICDLMPGELLENADKLGCSSYASKMPIANPMSNTGGVVMIDTIYSWRSDHKNTILHATMQLLGLGHPTYSSLEEQKKYRSILEDGDSTPLGKACIKAHGDTLKAMECMTLPDYLTPLDANGFIAVWGESDNNTPYCLETRNAFFKQYSEYFERVDVPHTEL